jgi:hypothetical protein
MSSAVVDTDPAVLLARFHDVITDLQNASLTCCTDTEVVEFWQGLETGRRMLETVDHTVIGQVETRHLPYEYGARTTAVLARNLLRISSPEANSRVANAHSCGAQTSLTGETLPPIYPLVAAAQRAGTMSRQQANIACSTIDRLPAQAQLERGTWVENLMVDQAAVLDPGALRKVADHVRESFDPDGGPGPDYRDRTREFRLSRRPDGSSHVSGDTTAELSEYLLTLFDTLAKPAPEPGAMKDTRSVGQRQHDALLDALKLLFRADLLPDAGGVTTTIVLTTSAENWINNTGTTQTGHGVQVPTPEAKKWAAGDAQVIAVALNQLKAVIAYSDKHRLFTENQRFAMTARDKGCAFPGCDSPPQKCESHHVTEWQETHHTSVDNGMLLCSFNHRNFEQAGWRGIMINGIPHFIPPRWLDPEQKPLRNRTHDPEREVGPFG